MAQEHRILVLAADATEAELVEMQLRKANVRAVTQRVSARDQLQKALRNAPPDLVIADAATPRLDLAATIAEARRTLPSTSWIALIASTAEDTVVTLMKAGASDVINKKGIARLGASAATALAAATDSVPAAVRTLPKPPPLPAHSERPAPHPTVSHKPKDDLFKAIVEHAGDLIAVLDQQGRRLYNNPAFREILDDPNALRGTVAIRDVHPDDRQRVAEALRAFFDSGEQFRMEFRLMDQNGDVRVVESVGTHLPPQPDGSPQAAMISRDVTDRARSASMLEEMLKVLGNRSGEEYFRELVALVARLLQVRYVLVSECLYHPCERVRTLAYWAGGSPMPGFEYDIADTTCESVFATGEPVVFGDNVQQLFPRETALVSMGARSYVGVPLIGTAGRTIGHMFVMDDRPMPDATRALDLMTLLAPRTGLEVERHAADRALSASEARLRSILESLQDGVLVTDSLGIVTYTNDRFAMLTGVDSVRMIGKTVQQFLSFGGNETLEGMIAASDRCGTLRRGDGELSAVVATGSELRDTTGKMCGAILLVRPSTRDILNG